MNALVADLARLVGPDAVADGPADRSAYAHDLWPRQLLATRAKAERPPGPRAIVWPTSDEQLAQVLALAARTGARVTPFGAGSGVVGGLALHDDVIAVDTKRLRALHTVDRERGYAVADAGILGQHLEDQLARRGVTLGHFPSSISCSTLGGWVATRSAGQCSGRYGKIEDMVLGVEGVLPTGEPYACGAPAPGAVDHRALLVGSESLFGFLTRATVRVWPAPVERRYLSFTFATMERAWECLRAVYQAGLRPAVARLYDPFDTYVFRSGARRAQREGHGHGHAAPADANPLHELLLRRALHRPRALNALNDAFGARVFGRCLLVFLFEVAPGEEPLATQAAERARALSVAQGGRDEGEALARRWLARRHSVSYRAPPAYAKGLWVDTMEVAAPWSKLEALYEGVGRALGEGGFVMAHMSHAYPDGCSIYFTFAGASPTDARALEVYAATWSRALRAAHDAGGTTAHHHGVGRHKRGAMRLELGAGVRVIEALARAADPRGVMAPGPLVPDAAEGFAARDPASDPLCAPCTTPIELDAASQLARVDPSAPLALVQRALASRGYALALRAGEALDPSRTVAAWLAERSTEAALEDPVEQRVAGYTAVLPDGAVARTPPAPRRSCGPELLTLFAQGRGRFGALRAVTLRVVPEGSAPLRYTAPFAAPAPASASSAPLDAWLARVQLGGGEGSAR